MKALKVYRQGDVLITRVAEIPAGLEQVPRENGRLILAHGEVTGHAHVVEGEAAMLTTDLRDLEERFLRVEADALVNPPIFEDTRTGEHVTADGTVDAPPVEHRHLVGFAPDKVPGAIVVHEEHHPFVLPPGDYRVGGQVEYSPEAIRNVAD